MPTSIVFVRTFHRAAVLCLSVVAVLTMPVFAGADPAPGAASTAESRIEQWLQQMTLEEKISLLGGDATGFNAPGIERLGIPPIRMSDGPVGVRAGESTAWPVSINMAATWDPALIQRYGEALAEEVLAKGKTCILGPCVGIHRFPLGGRNFESFGEDPWLSSRIAVGYIRGVQSRGVIATVKHFACNDQEWERTNVDAIVDERALREIHLVPFEAAVREAGVWAVMSSYNLINGRHASENRILLTDILKGDWKFPGLVMSDWVSVYSTVDAANAGLDLEMPHPVWFGEKLLAAVRAGQVSTQTIDDKVRRHLRARLAMGLFDHPAPAPDPSVIQSGAHQALALEIAQKSIVLLKNDGVLPLRKDAVKRIALIGPNAVKARTGGGGSSQVQPWRRVSPLDGLRRLLGPGVEIVTAEAVNLDPFKPARLPPELLRTPDGRSRGLLGAYFNNPDFAGAPVFTRVDPAIDFDFSIAGPDTRIGRNDFSIRWTGTLTVTQSRKYKLSVSSDDGSRLSVDGKLLVDNWGAHGELALAGEIFLEAGRPYPLKLEYNQLGGDASVRLGWKDPADTTPEPTIAEAVAAAQGADVAIVCVGNTASQEGEGADVRDFLLSGGQDELVRAVAAANPNTIVVLNGGVPFRVKDWLGGVRALVAAFYPGQEGGDALAQILFGDVNPSGKLPFSYIQEKAESPAFAGYQDAGLKAPYREGIFVGYRYYEKNGIAPLFPFGYGLSYTAFRYDHLQVTKTGDWTCAATVEVTNTGGRAGEEVVQLYVGQDHPSLPRPLKELKAFAKVALQPGETRTVTLTLGPRAFQFYDPKAGGWVAGHDGFTIDVGASSRDIRQTARLGF